MYRIKMTPLGDGKELTAVDHSAVFAVLNKAFRLPAELGADALPTLRGIALGVVDPTPYNELIAAIEATGSIRIEAVRYPDVKTGLTGPDVMNIAR